MYKQFFFIIVFIASIFNGFSQPQRPFPQNIDYYINSIKPEINSVAMNNTVIDFYNKWKARYIKNNCPDHPDWYYVWADDVSHLEGVICVSEGIGYGMIITALMAGYDPDAKVIFDGLREYYKSHRSLSNTNTSLMSWVQLDGCTDPQTDDRTSATDGDIDIAFGLVLAHNQWRGSEGLSYFWDADSIIRDILKYDFNNDNNNIMLGDGIKKGDQREFDMRASDFMPYFFRKVALYDKYKDIVTKGYSILTDLQSQHISGLLPDFIVGTNSIPKAANPGYLESEYDGCYYYNACRVPLRVGLDYLFSGSGEAKNIIIKINDFFVNSSSNDPGQIYSGYYLDGKLIPGHDYSDVAFIAPLCISAMTDIKYQSWLNSLWNMVNSISFDDSQYYGNSLKMLALLIMSGNFWMPEFPLSIFYNSLNEESEICYYKDNKIFIVLNDFIESEYSLKIFNYLGYTIDVLCSIQIDRNNGSTLLSAKPNLLKPGIYFAELSNKANKSKYLRFFVF